MRIHRYRILNDVRPAPVSTKRIKYKIWDFGDMCTIAYSSSHVESYRFVDRKQDESGFIETLEKLPVGYTPSSDTAICSIVDIGLTADSNVFIYGNYLLTVSNATTSIQKHNTAVKAKEKANPNPTHTRQFKRSPIIASVGIPLVMPAPQQQSDKEHPRKIKPRIPMMSIPLVALPAATE